MSEALFSLVLIGVGLAHGICIGIIIGQFRERRWQIQKRKMNAKLRRHSNEVDRLVNAHVSVKDAQEYFNRVN